MPGLRPNRAGQGRRAARPPRWPQPAGRQPTRPSRQSGPARQAPKGQAGRRTPSTLKRRSFLSRPAVSSSCPPGWNCTDCTAALLGSCWLASLSRVISTRPGGSSAGRAASSPPAVRSSRSASSASSAGLGGGEQGRGARPADGRAPARCSGQAPPRCAPPAVHSTARALACCGSCAPCSGGLGAALAALVHLACPALGLGPAGARVERLVLLPQRRLVLGAGQPLLVLRGAQLAQPGRGLDVHLGRRGRGRAGEQGRRAVAGGCRAALAGRAARRSGGADRSTPGRRGCQQPALQGAHLDQLVVRVLPHWPFLLLLLLLLLGLLPSLPRRLACGRAGRGEGRRCACSRATVRAQLGPSAAPALSSHNTAIPGLLRPQGAGAGAGR
jgi:hypothetical protein